MTNYPNGCSLSAGCSLSVAARPLAELEKRQDFFIGIDSDGSDLEVI